MKKVLLCVILSLCMFAFPNFLENIKAKDLTVDESNFNVVNYRNMSDEEMNEKGLTGVVALRNYAKEQISKNPNNYDNYYISHAMGYSGYYLVLYKSENLLYNYLSLYFINNACSDYGEFGLILNSNDSSIASAYYISSASDTNIKSYSLMELYVDSIEKKALYQDASTIEYSCSLQDPLKFNIYVDTDLPIYVKDNITISTKFNPNSYTLKIKQENGNILTYEVGKMVIDKNGKLVGDKPTIEMSYEDILSSTGEILSTFINTHFTVFDREKYIYEYSIDSTNNFKEILDIDYSEEILINGSLVNVFSYKFVNKGFIIVRIRDRETLEYVTSNTFNVSHLSNASADIVFEEQKYCGDFHHGTNFESEDWNICTRLHFTITHYNSRLYDVFYKIGENGQWIRTYEETTSIDLYENTRVYVSILDKVYNRSLTRYYDVNSIDPPEVVNAPYVEPYFWFNENNNSMTLKLFFINYNPNSYDYKYMVGTADRNNLQLIDNIVKEDNSLYYTRSFVFTTETYVIVEIDDKLGNYVKSYTFQINFDDYIDNSMTGVVGRIESFFGSFKDVLQYVSNLFSMFFDMFPSMLQTAIVVIFILFLIFVILRMGGWKQ